MKHNLCGNDTVFYRNVKKRDWKDFKNIGKNVIIKKDVKIISREECVRSFLKRLKKRIFLHRVGIKHAFRGVSKNDQ